MFNFSQFPGLSRQGLSLVAALGLLLPSLASPLLCSPAGAQSAQARPEFSPSRPSAETDYTLGGGDRIRMDIFQVADFSREYLVLVDGTVVFPLIGTVRVEGLSLAQLGELLTQRYSKFIKRPLVTVGLLVPRPLRLAISGEVNSPGSYTIPIEQGQQFPSLTDILERAGGLTATADVSQVQLKRFFQGRQQVLTLNLWELFYQGNQSQNVTLRDGDSIIVPTSTTINALDVAQLADANFGINANQEIDVAIVGEVYRPGTYKLQPGQYSGISNVGTIRRQPPTITQAIRGAGGIKPLADIRTIQLRRFTRLGEVQSIEVDLWSLLEKGGIEQDLILRQGDTIIIPTAKELPPEESQTLAAASFAPEKIQVTVVGEVRGPGRLELPPNAPLNQALAAAGSFDLRRADQETVQLIRINPNGTVSSREVPVDFSKGIGEENNPSLRDKDVIVVRRSGLAATTDFISTLFSPLGAILSPASAAASFVNITQ